MISKETAEKRAKARVKQEDGHDLVIEWLEDDQKRAYMASNYLLATYCSCGEEVHPSGWSTRTGAVSARNIKAFNQHINQVRNTSTAMGEPILIGYVHKQRVSNEIWLFNNQNDIPDKQSRAYGINFYWAWNILLKNQAGWSLVGGANTKEAATTKATQYLDNKSLHFEIEYVFKEEVGVEAPVATIVNSVARLVGLAEATKDNPIKLADLLKTLDEGVMQLKILIPLRDSVKERLERSLTLDL